MINKSNHFFFLDAFLQFIWKTKIWKDENSIEQAKITRTEHWNIGQFQSHYPVIAVDDKKQWWGQNNNNKNNTIILIITIKQTYISWILGKPTKSNLKSKP